MKRFLEGLKCAAAILLWLMLMGLIEIGLMHIYQRTLSPWWFFFYVNFVDSLYGLLTVWAFFLWMLLPDREERKDPDWREKWKNSYRKTMRIGGMATVIFLVALNLFPVSRRFEVVRLNEEKPSRFAYKFAILKDAASRETKIVRGSREDVKAGYYTYNVRSGRYGTKTTNTYYLAFRDGEISFQSFLADRTLVNYYQLSEKILQKGLETDQEWIYEKEYAIEYYPHAGLLKAVDGCNPYDGESLQTLVDELKVTVAEKEERERQETEALRQEQSRQFSIAYDLFMNGTGRYLSDIEAELAKENISYEYEVVNLSTCHYEPGQIAFYDHPNRTVYVVKDQFGEEMVEVPYFDKKWPVQDIEKVLKEAGITYLCEELDRGEGDVAKKRLYTYYCGPGTIIPKEFVYWFTIR